MKNRSFLSIILMSTIVLISTNSASMENNNKIGPIDRLMLARYINQNGYKAIRKEINGHEFELGIRTGEKGDVYLTEKNPFSISFLCHKKSDSKLSKAVFPIIHQASIQKATISMDTTLNKQSCFIDECTTWEPTENSKTIRVTAAFYNKKALLTALNWELYQNNK